MSIKPWMEQYEKFDSGSYLLTRFVRIDDMDSRSFNKLIETFRRGEYGGKLLDVGCGPCVMVPLIASCTHKEIHLCDYCSVNTDAVRDWVNNEGKGHDWTPFSRVIADGEGLSISEVEQRARASISRIFRCDILDGTTLPEGELYDTITCTHCLDAACAGPEDFMLGLKNLRKLLLPKGVVIFTVNLTINTYNVGGVEFPTLTITKDEVCDIVKELGMRFVELKTTDCTKGFNTINGGPYGGTCYAVISLAD